MEDLDTPRVVKGSADDILRTLEAFGFEWDGDVLYQSQRFDVYEQAIHKLLRLGWLYACECSRKQLLSLSPATGPLGLIYPGLCRDKNLKAINRSLRLKVDQAGIIEFLDLHYGPYELDVSSDVGDIVLKRVDNIYAYHLAVVIDDAYQKVTEIVRGADLLEVTCVHLFINRILNLPDASYLHVPLIKNAAGKKLSKQTGATALDLKQSGQQLVKALAFLGQDIPAELSKEKPARILEYAISAWDCKRIPSPS